MYTTILQLGASPIVGYGLVSHGVEALRPIVIASLLSIFVFKDSWLGKGLWLMCVHKSHKIYAYVL